jgi:tyrosyl-tRNA synthetase
MDFSTKISLENFSSQEKLNLITRNLEEVINLEKLEQKLEQSATVVIYWGVTPTKPPHLAYFLPLLKIRDFIQAGCVVKIFLADVHAYLEEGFQTHSRIEERTIFYEFIITEMLKRLGVNKHEYFFERGSNIQLGVAYTRDLLRFSTLVDICSAQEAASEIIGKENISKLSSLIYPLMQALDEIALEADAQLGGSDQRNIFTFSLYHIGKPNNIFNHYCSYLINPLIPSLSGKSKMSCHEEQGRISFLDSNRSIKRKIQWATCDEKFSDTSSNSILAILKFILFPIFDTIILQRAENRGGNLFYNNFQSLEDDYINEKFTVSDLKNNTANYIIELIKPIRTVVQKNMRLYQNAYED